MPTQLNGPTTGTHRPIKFPVRWSQKRGVNINHHRQRTLGQITIYSSASQQLIAERNAEEKMPLDDGVYRLAISFGMSTY